MIRHLLSSASVKGIQKSVVFTVTKIHIQKLHKFTKSISEISFICLIKGVTMFFIDLKNHYSDCSEPIIESTNNASQMSSCVILNCETNHDITT